MADMTQSAPSKSNSRNAAAKNTAKDTPKGLDIHDPDALQEGLIDIWSWIEHNSAIVVGLIAVIVLGAIVYSVSIWWSGRAEKKAQEAYYAVESKYAKIKEGFDRAKYKALMPQAAAGKDDKSASPAASGDLAKDYGTVISDLEKVARDHAGTAAGAQAAILAADTYLNYQQPDKAIEIARAGAQSMSEKNMLASLVKMELGNAYAVKGDCKEAVKVWGQIIDNKAVGFLHADASLRSGLCYEALNEPQKAMEMYQKVSAEGGGAESTSATAAKGFMRALELKLKPAAPAKQG